MFIPERGPELLTQSPFLVPASIRDTTLSGSNLIAHVADVTAAVAPRQGHTTYPHFSADIDRMPLQGFRTNCIGRMSLLHAYLSGFEELDSYGVIVSYSSRSRHAQNAVRFKEGAHVIDSEITDDATGNYIAFKLHESDPSSQERDTVIMNAVQSIVSEGPVTDPITLWFASWPGRTCREEGQRASTEPLARPIADKAEIDPIKESTVKVTVLPSKHTSTFINRLVIHARNNKLTS